MQQMLDWANFWSRRYGINFAPTKCEVLAPNQDGTLFLHGQPLPHCTKFKYLGIYIRQDGIDWDTTITTSTKKTTGLINYFKSKGMHGGGWRPNNCLAIYRTFLRPTMEYGVALQILNKPLYNRLQEVQKLAMRTYFSVDFQRKSTSLFAMHTLSGLVPMDYRCQELAVRYWANVHNQLETSRFVYQMYVWMSQPRNRNTDKCLRKIKAHPLWDVRTHFPPNWNTARRRRNPPITKKKLYIARRQAILNLKPPGNASDNNVGAVISLHPQCKANSLLNASYINFVKQRRLIQWRLGKIAFHQKCTKCANVGLEVELSRQHAVNCAGVSQLIMPLFPYVTQDLTSRRTIIDEALNSLQLNSFEDDEMEEIDTLTRAIELIMEQCANWTRDPLTRQLSYVPPIVTITPPPVNRLRNPGRPPGTAGNAVRRRPRPVPYAQRRPP
jgi:hypothetical protein